MDVIYDFYYVVSMSHTGTSQSLIISLFGSVFCWDQRQTKRLSYCLSPKFRLTNQHGAQHCLLHNVIADVITGISIFLCLFMISEKVKWFSFIKNLIS